MPGSQDKSVASSQMIWGQVPSHHASSVNRWSLQESLVLHNVGQDHSISHKITYVGYTKLQEGDGMFLGPKTSQNVLVISAPHSLNSIKRLNSQMRKKML